MILDESEITTSEVPKNASKGPWWNPCQFCSTNPELFNVLFILILIVLLILTIVVISSCFCLYKMDKRLYFPTRSMGNWSSISFWSFRRGVTRQQRSSRRTVERTTTHDGYERPSDIALTALRKTDNDLYEQPGPIPCGSVKNNESDSF